MSCTCTEKQPYRPLESKVLVPPAETESPHSFLGLRKGEVCRPRDRYRSKCGGEVVYSRARAGHRVEYIIPNRRSSRLVLPWLFVGGRESLENDSWDFDLVIDCLGGTEGRGGRVRVVRPTGYEGHWSFHDLDRIVRLTWPVLRAGGHVLLACKEGVRLSPIAAAAILLADDEARDTEEAVGMAMHPDRPPGVRGRATLQDWWVSRRPMIRPDLKRPLELSGTKYAVHRPESGAVVSPIACFPLVSGASSRTFEAPLLDAAARVEIIDTAPGFYPADTSPSVFRYWTCLCRTIYSWPSTNCVPPGGDAEYYGYFRINLPVCRLLRRMVDTQKGPIGLVLLSPFHTPVRCEEARPGEPDWVGTDNALAGMLASGSDLEPDLIGFTGADRAPRFGPSGNNPAYTILFNRPGLGSICEGGHTYTSGCDRVGSATWPLPSPGSPERPGHGIPDNCGAQTTAAMNAVMDAAYFLIHEWERKCECEGLQKRLVIASYSNGGACASRWIRYTTRSVHALVDFESPGDSFEMTKSMNCITGSDIPYMRWAHCGNDVFLDTWKLSLRPPIEVIDDVLGGIIEYPVGGYPTPVQTPLTSDCTGEIVRSEVTEYYNLWYGYSFDHITTPQLQLCESRTAWANTTLETTQYIRRLLDIREDWRSIETLQHLAHRGNAAFIRVQACNDHAGTNPAYLLRQPVRALFAALYAGTTYGGDRTRNDVFYSSQDYYLTASGGVSADPYPFHPITRGITDDDIETECYLRVAPGRDRYGVVVNLCGESTRGTRLKWAQLPEDSKYPGTALPAGVIMMRADLVRWAIRNSFDVSLVAST